MDPNILFRSLGNFLQGKVGYFIEISRLTVEKKLTIKLCVLHNCTVQAWGTVEYDFLF